MTTLSYQTRRGQLQTYFDRTAVEAWSRLTSDAPVGRIRATVRAGRTEMRNTLLSWLPADLRGMRLLDAGCGTGALAIETARRGAVAVAIDLSPKLIGLAWDRAPSDLGKGSIDFRVGDLLDPSLGRFDFVVAMDSLIHYEARDMARVVTGLAQRTSSSVLFTFAPRTAMLGLMHSVGKLFPRGDRAPAIEPVAESRIINLLGDEPGLELWQRGRTKRISSGFYISQALELTSL
jgi:magnesium-protoporphyrin O-methyltransferase